MQAGCPFLPILANRHDATSGKGKGKRGRLMSLVESGLSGAMIGLVAGFFWILAMSIGTAHWTKLGRRLLAGSAGGALGGALGGLILAMILPEAPQFLCFLLPLACMIIGSGLGATLSSKRGNNPAAG
jgi:hypothetical protein